MGHHLKFSMIKDCATGAKSCFRRQRLWSKQCYSLFHRIDSQSVSHKWPQFTICRHNSSQSHTKRTRSWSCTERFIDKRSYSQSVSDTDSVRKFILDNTELSKDHLTPEIALHLITPKCRLWWSSDEDCEVEDPFWAFYWPGGQALTRYGTSIYICTSATSPGLGLVGIELSDGDLISTKAYMPPKLLFTSF